jgi:hypothetical protein
MYRSCVHCLCCFHKRIIFPRYSNVCFSLLHDIHSACHCTVFVGGNGVARWFRYYTTSRDLMTLLIFTNLPIFQAVLGPGLHTASNRNEYHKHKYKCFGEVESGRCVRLISPPSVSRLSRQCGILNSTQSHRTARPITVITLPFCLCVTWLSMRLGYREILLLFLIASLCSLCVTSNVLPIGSIYFNGPLCVFHMINSAIALFISMCTLLVRL